MLMCILLSVSVLANLDEQSSGSVDDPVTQFRQLSDQYAADALAYQRAANGAKTVEQIAAARSLPGRSPISYAGRFIGLAKAFPGTPTAEASLVWVASHVAFGSETEEAKRILIRDHLASDQLGPVFAFQILNVGSEATDRLLKETAAKSPHREMRALAYYWRARLLLDQAEASRQIKRGGQLKVELAPVVLEGWGTDAKGRLARLDPRGLEIEGERIFEVVAREYPDVTHNDKIRRAGTLGTLAAGYLRELHDLVAGRPAPEIEGRDLDGGAFHLSDYRGRVVMLDFGSHFQCGACRAMYPHERALVHKLKGRPFALVTVDADDNLENVRTAWKTEGNGWRCVWDAGWDGPINTTWNIQEYPTIFVLDHTGVIRFKAARDPGPEELNQVIYKLLAEAEALDEKTPRKP